MYGKKVRDSTTCLGYISWTDDAQCVSYKDLCGLSMSPFQGFVRDQVGLAQEQLEGLLLLHPDERREDLAIDFSMHRVVDNADIAMLYRAAIPKSGGYLQQPSQSKNATKLS